MSKKKPPYAIMVDRMLWDDVFTSEDAAKKYAEKNLNDYYKVQIYKCELVSSAVTPIKWEWT
jgi:hypothetical protein